MTGGEFLLESAPGAEVVVDGRRYLYFGGTSYLGLHGDSRVLDAACAATRRYGIHTATSRSRFDSPITREVERAVASWFGTEDAFWFATGYAGNSILAQATAARHDAVLVDEAAHYSVHDAARLAGLPVHAFRTCDPDALRDRLAALPAVRRPLVMTDGVFASTGRIAPVGAYRDLLAEREHATILVDDAHGLFAIGPHGRGALDELGCWPDAVNGGGGGGVEWLLCGTLSKAAGGHGGIVPGSRAFVAALRRESHWFDGASAPLAAAAGASVAALRILTERPELRERLRANALRVRAELRGLGIAVEDWPTPIVAIRHGDGAAMARLSAALRAEHILVPYVRSYAGVGAEGQLRLAVFATHTDAMIDRLIAALRRLL